MGKLELEFKISSRFLLCEIGMNVSFLDKKCNIYNVGEVDLTSISLNQDIQQAINFFELISLINKGAELSIFSLEYAESDITNIKELENNTQNLSDNDLIDFEISFSKAILSKTSPPEFIEA